MPRAHATMLRKMPSLMVRNGQVQDVLKRRAKINVPTTANAWTTVSATVMVVVLVLDAKLMHAQKLAIIVVIAILMVNVNALMGGQVRAVICRSALAAAMLPARGTENAKKNRWTMASCIATASVMLVSKEKDVRTQLALSVMTSRTIFHAAQKVVKEKEHAWVENVIATLVLQDEAVDAAHALMSAAIMEDVMVENASVMMTTLVHLAIVNVALWIVPNTVCVQ